MSHQVFVPVTDELIYNHPEQIEGPLIPYAAGMECHEWLSIEINPDESDGSNGSDRSKEIRKVEPRVSQMKARNLRLAYSA